MLFLYFHFLKQKNIFILYLCHHSESTYGFHVTRILTWGLLVF